LPYLPLQGCNLGIKINDRLSIEDVLTTTDGSYLSNDTYSGHSWVFAKKDGKLSTSSHGSPYGDLLSPLRSKLLGILSALYILYKAEIQFPLPTTKVELLCDSREAINLVLHRNHPSLKISNQVDNNIIMEIFSLRKLIRTVITPVYVKQSKKLKTPSLCEDLHDEAHHIASMYTADGTPSLPNHPIGGQLPFHLISLRLANQTYQGKSQKPVTAAVFTKDIRDKITKDTKWDNSTLQGVDFQAIESALQTCPRPARNKYTKLMFELNQINYLNNKYYNTTSTCPSCQLVIKTFQHVLSCLSTSMVAHRQLALETLTQEINSILTPSQIAQSILSRITLTEPSSPSPVHDSLMTALKAQDSIGWHQFLLGRISKKWQLAYVALYDSKRHPRLASWISKFITLIWSYTHSLWKGWNQEVHGRTSAELISQGLSQYHNTILSMYQEYTQDPFLFPAHLFDRPLSNLLLMSEDATQCWIQTAKEAKRTQKLMQNQTAASRNCLAQFLGKK